MKKLYISTAIALITAFTTPAIAQEEKMQDFVGSPVAVDTSVLDRTAVKRHYERKPYADEDAKSVSPAETVLETIPAEQNIAVTAEPVESIVEKAIPETEVSETKQPVTMQPIISEGDNGPTAIAQAEKEATEAWEDTLPEKKPADDTVEQTEPEAIVDADIEAPVSVEGDMLQYRDAPIAGVEDSNAEEVINIITQPAENTEVVPEQHRVLADSLPKPSLAVPDVSETVVEAPALETPATEIPQEVDVQAVDAVDAVDAVSQTPAVITDTNVIRTTPDQLPAALKKELDMEMKKTYQAVVPSGMLKENKLTEKTLSVRPSAKPKQDMQAVDKDAQELKEVVAPALETTQVPDVPEVTETTEAVDNTAMSLSLMFDGNDSDITQSMKQQLDSILQRLKGNQSMRVQLHAFATGQDGNPSSARRISLARALSVREYLVDQGGLRPTRMDVRALGDQTQQQPVDRIDFVFVQ